MSSLEPGLMTLLKAARQRRPPVNGIHELYAAFRDCPDVRDRWMGFVSRHIYTCRFERGTVYRSEFEIYAKSRSVDGFTMARITTSAGRSRLRRDAAAMAGDSQDRYALYMSLTGDMQISHYGRSQSIGPGEYTFTSATEPAIYDKGGGNDVLCLLVPRYYVEQRCVGGERICAEPYSAERGLRSLVFDTVNAFECNAWDLGEDAFQKSVRIIADLVLLALSEPVDRLSSERSIRAANLGRAKRIIRQRLANPDLTLSDIAKETGISLRYLHNLFKDEGRTMWEYLKAERLERARRLLEFPSPTRNMTVTEASLQCGFSNLSQFSTSFKRAFGISPRDMLKNC